MAGRYRYRLNISLLYPFSAPEAIYLAYLCENRYNLSVQRVKPLVLETWGDERRSLFGARALQSWPILPIDIPTVLWHPLCMKTGGKSKSNIVSHCHSQILRTRREEVGPRTTALVQKEKGLAQSRESAAQSGPHPRTDYRSAS